MYNSLHSLARKGLQATIFSRPLQTSARMASSGFRVERDNVGEVKIPSDRYYGARTARYAMNNLLGPSERMPISMIHAVGEVKGAAAETNKAAGQLDPKLAAAIKQAADEVATGRLNEHFPLAVWSPSGKEMDINANEVISNRAIEILGGELGSKYPVHPDDHVNMGQNVNITLPAAMKIARTSEVNHVLVPGMRALCYSLDTKAQEFKGHGSLGQVFTAHAQRLNSWNEKFKSDWMKETDMESGSDLVEMYELGRGVAKELQSVAKELSQRGDTKPAMRAAARVIRKLRAVVHFNGARLSESRHLINKNVLSSVRSLGETAMWLSTDCVAGIKANTASGLINEKCS